MKAAIHAVLVAWVLTGWVLAASEAETQKWESDLTTRCTERLQSLGEQAETLVVQPVLLVESAHEVVLRDAGRVRHLLSGMRFYRPDVEWVDRDGACVALQAKCRCYGDYRVSVFAGEKLIGQFLMRHRKHIEDEKLTEGFRMEMAEDSIESLYQFVEKEAKAGEPSATDNPGGA